TPTAVNNPFPNLLKYRLHESVAYLTIWNNIKNPIGLGIPSGKTSKELWSYLEKEYLLVSQLARQRKEDALRACRYVDGMDGKITGEGGYLEKIRTLRKAAVIYGAEIPDLQFITIFLDSFPRTPEWSVITGSLMTEKSINLIAARLQDIYLHRSGDGASQTPSIQRTTVLEVTAMEQRIAQLEQALSASHNDRRGSGKCMDLVCTNPNCPPKNRVGHTTDTCFAMGGGKQGQYPSWWKGKKPAPLPTANAATTEATS
ncbi:hypothetical protein L218DRAFT_832193, partial [Marasmius fiardii PR-910]